MSEKANNRTTEKANQVTHSVNIPDNTLGIFITCEGDIKNIQVSVYDMVSESIRETQEYDAMTVVAHMILDSVESVVNYFTEEVDQDFTSSSGNTDDKHLSLPFPELNKAH